MKNNIRACRKRANLTSIQLAEMIGVRQGTISAWETGAKDPRIPKLVQLARVLDCTTDELLGLSGPKPGRE